MSKNKDLVRVQNVKEKTIDLPVLMDEKGNVLFPAKTLIPGGNNVSQAHLRALASHAQVAWYFENRWLVLDHASKLEEPEGPLAPDSLEQYTDEGALKLVGLEHDRETLVRWLKSEHREEIKQAIAFRLKG